MRETFLLIHIRQVKDIIINLLRFRMTSSIEYDRFICSKKEIILIE